MQILLPCLLVRYCGMNVILIFYFVMIECYNQGKYQVLIVYIYKLYTGTIIH